MPGTKDFPYVETNVLSALLHFGNMYESEIGRHLVGTPTSTTASALATLKKKGFVDSAKHVASYRSRDGREHFGQQLYSLTEYGRTIIEFVNNSAGGFRPSVQSPYSPIRDERLGVASRWLDEGRRKLRESRTVFEDSAIKLRFSRQSQTILDSFVAAALEQYITPLDTPHSTSTDALELLKNRVDIGIMPLELVKKLTYDGNTLIMDLVPVLTLYDAGPIFVSKKNPGRESSVHYPKDTHSRKLVATEGSKPMMPTAVDSSKEVYKGHFDGDFASVTAHPPMEVVVEKDMGAKIVATKSSTDITFVVARSAVLGSKPLSELIAKTAELGDMVSTRPWRYKFIQEYALHDMVKDFAYLKEKSKTIQLLGKAALASSAA